MRAVVVVPDATQRHALAMMLSAGSFIDVIAEFARSIDAVKYVASSAADVVFLDVAASEPAAFVNALPPDPMRQIVLVADREEDPGLTGSKSFAADRLIRPLTRARLAKALVRVETRRGKAKPAENLTILRLEEPQTNGHAREPKIAFRSKRRITVLHSGDIRFISAQGNYLKVHAHRQVQRFRDTISNVERKLDPRMFMRIHRSTIINLQHIREVRNRQSGDAVVVLFDGTALGISRTYRDAIHRHFA
jgi:two-component system, LytTR family, response regulator